MDKELLNTIKANREDWAIKHYNKHETELNLDEMKALDAEWPGWGLSTCKNGMIVEISMGGTRARNPIDKSEYKISYPKSIKGYPLLSVYDSSTKLTSPNSIHRLVAQAFVENPDPENKTDINHINGDKWNNAYWNLEWVTKSENSKLAVETGLMPSIGQSNPNNKYTEAQIRQVCQLLQDQPNISYRKMSKETGISVSSISAIYKGEQWSSISKDYKFPPRSDNKGESNVSAKFSSAQIEEVCRLLDEGKLYVKDISYKTGVSENTVSKISRGLAWTSISKNHPFYQAKFGK